jgi:7-cyano-7-deazaguanine tRNA-ribosyltransferase
MNLDFMQVYRTADWQFGKGAGAALTTGEMKCERSRKTHKMRTVYLDGEHILSLRAGDALWTLKPAGAKLLHAALPAPAMRVVAEPDSVPFNRDGKSLFSKFVADCDLELRPGDECLVVDGTDTLVAVGKALLCAEEMADFQTGMAVKVRDGFSE